MLLAAAFFLLFAQDAREALGPSQSSRKGPHPLVAEMRAHPAALRPELRGVHPRVFATSAELDELRVKAKGSHRAAWQRALANLRALQDAPAAPPAQERRAQNTTAINLAGAAFAYRIEGDPAYLAAARRYLEAALAYDVWGHTYSKPNVDLAAGHLLYGVGWAYDLLYHDLTPEERERCRKKLSYHARLLAAHYDLKPGRMYSYSQNHVSIPLAGLAVAAYALWDEDPQAAQWASLVRAFYSRILQTYSQDGQLLRRPGILGVHDPLADSLSGRAETLDGRGFVRSARIPECAFVCAPLRPSQRPGHFRSWRRV